MIDVFISYRRADTASAAKMIYEYLCEELDTESVFMDISEANPTASLAEVLERVRKCDVLLVLIGRNWIEELAKRQQNPDNPDLVFQEIMMGLTTDGVLVIPVAINDADLPPETMLPPQITSLAQRIAERVSENANKFDNDMAKLLRRIKLRHARFAGATRVHQRLPDELLFRRIQRAKVTIRIMCIWTARWRELFEPMFEALKANKDVKIQILLLDPENPCAVQRSRDLGERDEFTAEMIRENINDLKGFAKKLHDVGIDPNRIELKLYNATPTRILYMADEYVLIGSHPVGKFAFRAPHIEVYGGETEMFKNMDDHFVNLWSSGAHSRIEPLI
jgi:hypothetical protein